MTAPQLPEVYWSPLWGLICPHDFGGCYDVVTAGRTGWDVTGELSELPADAVRLIPPMTVDWLRAENEKLRAGQAALLALLDDVLEDLSDAIPYAGEYFDEKWSMSANLAEFRRRRALLGAAVSTSTPSQLQAEPELGASAAIPPSILISATRYALGHATYVVGETVDVLVAQAPLLPEQARAVMVRDIQRSLISSPGVDMDVLQWRRALAALWAERPTPTEEPTP